jgi:inner membrane protein
MDNLTHTLTGLMMSRCGLGNTLPNGGPVLLMIAANMPDVDILAGFGDTVSYLTVHRGYTHALLSSPVMALLALGLVCGIGRIRPTWQSFAASWLAVLSHLLLDYTNVYGIRLMLPFNAHWYHLDITDVVDPWIWLVLFLALAAPALAELVGSEIASAKRQGPKKSWAVFALVVMALYEGGRFISHQRALSMMEAHLYENPPIRYAATPYRLSPFSWRGTIIMEDSVLTVPIDVTSDYNPFDGRVDHPTLSSPAINAAKTTRPFQVFGDFNQLPFWTVQPEGSLIRVRLLDLRFGPPRGAGFVATALVTADGKVEESKFGMGLPAN